MNDLTVMNDLSKPLAPGKVSLTWELIEYALLAKTIMNDLSKPLAPRKLA